VLKLYHYILPLNTSFKLFRYMSSLIISSKKCSFTIFLNIFFTHYQETFLNHNTDSHPKMLNANNIQM